MPQEIFRQTNFNGGELSPKAIGRRDLEAYASSLALSVNMIPMAEGPIRRRPGLRHVDVIRRKLGPLDVSGVTVTTPNGGDGAAALDGTVLTTTAPIGAGPTYVIAEFDFGAPVEVGLVDLLNFAIRPAGAGEPDPAPPQYPWERPDAPFGL
jgi:hypothetical protein